MDEVGESNSLSDSGGEGNAERETMDSDVHMEYGEMGRLLAAESDFVCCAADRFDGEVRRGEDLRAGGGV